MIGFSLHEEGALLIGGPESGQVVKVGRGNDTVLVREEVELTAQIYYINDLTPHAVDARIGVYRRMGKSANFKWEGWQ